MPFTASFMKSSLRALLLAAACLCEAQASIQSYRFEGEFTGIGNRDANLVNAIGPSLGTAPVRIDVSFNAAATPTIARGGTTAEAPAITAARFQFAGFSGQTGPCDSLSGTFCRLAVANNFAPLGGTGYDTFGLSMGWFHSSALDQASGLGVELKLDFSLSMTDSQGEVLDSLDFDTDLRAFPLHFWLGQLIVHTPDNNGVAGTANFHFVVRSVSVLDEAVSYSAPEPGTVPEPGTPALLMACGLAALAPRRLLAQRRKH